MLHDHWDRFLILSTCADAIIALIVLLIPLRSKAASRIGAPRLLIAFVVTTMLFALRLPWMRSAGVNVFGLIHLVFLGCVLTVPLLGVCILLAGKRRRGQASWREVTPIARIAAMLAILPAVVGAYAKYVEPRRLCVETATAPIAGIKDQPAIRVGVLADLQTPRVGEHERAAVRLLMEQSPDLILLPGDFFQGPRNQWPEAREQIRALLRELHAPGGVFVVQGDCDSPESLRELLEGTSHQLLLNRVARTRVHGRGLAIGGIELGFSSLSARRTIEELEDKSGESTVRILLAHRPDPVLMLKPDSSIDLVVAGHTHGGQIVIPFYGPPMTLTEAPRDVAAGGLHLCNGHHIYISRGVGLERGQAPEIRFLCPPEVSILTLAGR